MEEHPVIEREYMRVHEENKTEASKVRWVGPDNVGGLAGQCGSSQTRMGTDPDNGLPLGAGAVPAAAGGGRGGRG